MTLYFLKLEPDISRLVRWAEGQKLLPRRGEDDFGYALHAMLAASFGPSAPKPFVLQRSPTRPAALLAYTTTEPDQLREHAEAFAEPDVAMALRLQHLAAKPMPDLFALNRRLGFSVRARPVVRTDRDGDRKRTREVDAFLAAIDDTEPGAGPDRGSVYQDWLARHLAQGGAVPERLALENFSLSNVQRRGRDRTLNLQLGPDASFNGTLRVADPQAFAALLARGVGRHRTFGYGMLLLKPVQD